MDSNTQVEEKENNGCFPIVILAVSIGVIMLALTALF